MKRILKTALEIVVLLILGVLCLLQLLTLENLDERIQVLESKVQEISDSEVAPTLEGDYVNENYGYALDLPENFKVYTEGYDNYGSEAEGTVWIGTKPDLWTDGFYVRVLDTDLATAYNKKLAEVKEKCVGAPYPSTECAPLPYSEETQMIDGVEAKVITYSTEMGDAYKEYYFEANNYVFEIQVSGNNTAAQNVIQTMHFAK